MEKHKVYLLEMCHGEFDDYRNWVASVHSSKEGAEAKMEKLKKERDKYYIEIAAWQKAEEVYIKQRYYHYGSISKEFQDYESKVKNNTGKRVSWSELGEYFTGEDRNRINKLLALQKIANKHFKEFNATKPEYPEYSWDKYWITEMTIDA